jgi:hypothetical protein
VEAGTSDYARFDSFPVDETGSWRIALDATSNRRTQGGFFHATKNAVAAEQAAQHALMTAASLAVKRALDHSKIR